MQHPKVRSSKAFLVSAQEMTARCGASALYSNANVRRSRMALKSSKVGRMMRFLTNGNIIGIPSCVRRKSHIAPEVSSCSLTSSLISWRSNALSPHDVTRRLSLTSHAKYWRKESVMVYTRFGREVSAVRVTQFLCNAMSSLSIP